MDNQKDWYNDRVTDVLSASNYVQKMTLEKTEKKLLLSLIQSDINKAVKTALERASKSD